MKRIAIFVGLLLLVNGLALQSQTPTPAKPQPAPSQPSASTMGRYQLVFNPSVRADTFLLDTQTGKVWIRTQITNVKGTPDIWKYQDRIDNEAQEILWDSQQTFLPNTQ
jgi:hypothetical protein